MINDLIVVNRSINNVMNKYITENGYEDHVLFECKIMTLNSAVMFTMLMKDGLLKVEPFKAVFPVLFLQECEEDQVVSIVCDMFKSVVDQCGKLADKQEIANKTALTK
jgi:hypothetical protein